MKGSPAADAGLRAGDQVHSINNQQAANMTHAAAVEMVKNAGDRLDVAVNRGAAQGTEHLHNYSHLKHVYCNSIHKMVKKPLTVTSYSSYDYLNVVEYKAPLTPPHSPNPALTVKVGSTIHAMKNTPESTAQQEEEVYYQEKSHEQAAIVNQVRFSS